MTAPAAVPAPQSPPKVKIPIGLIAGIIAMVVVLLLPLPAELPPAGHRMLAILAFAVVVWITEAVSYEASAIMITTLMAFLLGTAPNVKNPDVLYGTSAAISMALTGFSNSALALVTGALFIAAAMTFTGLDKRIALVTLARVGTSTRRILLGAIAVTIVLSLVVPSATARSAAVVPIMLGVIAAFGVDKRSNIAAGIMIIVAQATSIWNVGIQTAAAQNLLTVGFMDKMLGERVAWSDWLIAGVPWSLLMSAVLVFVVLRLLPPESDAIAGGKEAVEASLRELGPMTSAQKRLILVSIMLLLFWSTEGKLHKFDTTSTTYFGLVLLMLPRFGVMTWKDVQTRIPWGAVIVFGVGISLGTALLTTQAGQWLGAQVVAHTGLDHLGPLGIFAILSAFLILIHLGFASATALTSAMLPILIAVLQTLPGDFNRLGMTMLLGFVVSYGFILPINAPQNMVALGTETFTAKQFAKVGIVLTIVGYLLMLLMSVTYWRWLGWM
ncbi:Sodium:sulfate symportert [Bordetella pertussis]|uniref:Sodium:sulfate symportert n=4 Tax=Bordetella pertussis TaxID=520 RepID=Q7U357_BORPE|nr:DASS family sodium-coupled anion symporter [Bordetella pertussis]ETH38475.1 transporter, DASS family [Bordetella pertussis H918]ETH41611.1 transporter, DASS family [Bordetella pertussis H939]ETH46549.1 transporter, DASS family [Bordetella pertussis H921]ETH73281.1 transporter, DASS family [Bordetella pertussis STO1-CHLA-0011]ETH84736.1 transporter, DASS family [Bordetella pertussis STO1-CHOC-0017]ETH87283.1 transporter, DASS family [Bordetella pertussis STO1-CHOC-0018]ETH92644.1 transport